MKNIFYVGSNCGDAQAGLRVFDIDLQTGMIRQLSQVDDAVDPIYLALSANGKLLYAAQRVAPGADGNVGGIAVYAVNGSVLVKQAEYSCAITVPCHLSLSRDGKRLLYAEYRNAWAGVFTVKPNGLLEGPIATIHHEGRGPNAIRQEAAHCHCAIMTPDDSRLCICDLGLDKVFVYEPVGVDGKLKESDGSGYRSAPGAGPRHLVFHPSARLAFLVTELNSSVVSFIHGGGGVLTPVGNYSMLPEDFTGETKAAAIKISPDGNWLLASNRGHDSIATFRIDLASGKLERKAINQLNGKFPRDFEFTPDGKFIVLGHKLSNEVAVYTFDYATGEMRQTANTVGMVKPLCFVFGK